MIRLLLILCSLASAVTRTHQDLIDLVGRKGDITHLYDLYNRTACASASEYSTPALAAASGAPCLSINDTLTLTANTTFPMPVLVGPGGYFKGAHTPTFSGAFDAGPWKIFDSTLSDPVFSRVKWVMPEWWGAVADGVTDDYRPLSKALSYGNQYDGPRALLSADGIYAFSSRLRIASPVIGPANFKLIGSGANFKLANNPASTEGGVAIVDCAILIVDGGSLDHVTIQTASSVDTNGNEGIWIACMQACYGKSGLSNVRMNGYAGQRRLNGLTVRYCTTAQISNVEGAYFTDGLKVDAANHIQFSGLFFEQIKAGGYPFRFTNSSHNMVNSLWTEGNDSTNVAYFFDGVNNYQVHGLKIGEVTSGTKMLAGVWVRNSERMNMTGLSTEGSATWTKAKTWITGTSKYNWIDSDMGPVSDSTSNSGIGKYSQNDFQNTKRGVIDSVSLATTATRRYIGRINCGSRLNVTMVARSAGITTPALAVHRLASGGYTSLGTLSYSTLTNKGDENTQGIDVTTTGPYYLTASAGTGDVDLEYEFSRASGAALVP